jgi:hypothetical protein
MREHSLKKKTKGESRGKWRKRRKKKKRKKGKKSKRE